MNSLSVLFVVALACGLLIQLWLARRQMVHVAAHRGAVPAAFSGQIPPEAHQKAADYTLAKTRFGQLELVAGAVWLLLWTVGGGLNLLDEAWHNLGLGPIWTGVGFILSTFTLMAVLDLPFSIYRTFVIEQRFGFNRTTPKLFITDLIKQVMLMFALGIPLVTLILWLMDASGDLWWLYVWLVWMSFSLIMMWAYPAFIAPLFNKFKELQDADLALRIQQLLQKCGFTSKGIFVMDGSTRSGHGNAYFTGLGSNKRIVFFDTLMETLKPAEIEAVLAHELGHFKRKHIQKRMIVMAFISLLGLALLGWLIGQPWFYSGLGIEHPSLHAALVLFLIGVPVFTFFLQPVMTYFSRKHEFEADDFAAQYSDPRALIEALVKLYKENASTLTPDPLYSAFHYSHPPASARVAHLWSKTHEKTVGVPA
ncbi:MAG TPA: M48 family metallopeptidase [Gammaproteobacteria bacterium]|nr:M48 family metallopeptidase [Gammaproteobacteria bacterium]